MNNLSQKENSVSKVIILDTNILIYAGNKPTEKAFLDLIRDLSEENFELVISKFSHFEIIQRKIEDGDLIIAATAFLNNSLLLTANRLDFPYPFFEEVRVNPVLYQNVDMPGVTKTLTAFLLKSNIDLIVRKLNQKINR